MSTPAPLRTTALATAAVLVLALPAAAQPSTGTADFSKYVAMGDSLTAAVVSGAVVEGAQESSYPLQIFRQVTGTDGAGFEQPLVSEPGLPPILELVSLEPLVVDERAGEGETINVLLERPYDNLGVPGANVADALDTLTDFGGGHDLVLRGLGTQLDQALSLAPTFVTLWLGSNDALAAATSGLVIEGVTLTPLAEFEVDYREIVDTLTAAGAQLAVANVPSVTSIPFVTTLPPFVADPVTEEILAFLIGPDGTLSSDDFVLLSAGELLEMGQGIPIELGGTGEPLPDEVILSAEEASTIADRVVAYNDVIRTVATEVGAALVDANEIFDEIVRDGFVVGGIEYGAAYLTGGIFSYDGVHPTTFGYGVVTNEFIRAINATYGAEIPLLDLFDLVFGETGRVPQVSDASGVVVSASALDNVRWTLGLPDVIEPPAEEPAPAPTVVPVGGPGPAPGTPPGAGPSSGPEPPRSLAPAGPPGGRPSDMPARPRIR